MDLFSLIHHFESAWRSNRPTARDAVTVSGAVLRLDILTTDLQGQCKNDDNLYITRTH
jgi:hypothetical protein